MDTPIATLRSLLSSTTASIPNLEAVVKAAQDRLRFATEKAAQIQGLLTMLETEAQAEIEAATPTVPLPPVAPVAPAEGKSISKGQRMEEEVTALLSLRGTVHRIHILQHLMEKGLMGHEKAPLAHLAAFLSGEKDKFVSDGKGNFSLRRNARAEPPRSMTELLAAARAARTAREAAAADPVVESAEALAPRILDSQE